MLTGFIQTAVIAGIIEINAQLVQLHHDYSTGEDGAHLDQDSSSSTCPTNPVQIDSQGFPNHIPCPCENEHIGNLTGTPGPTLIVCPPALIDNMRSELNKFSNLEVYVMYDQEPGPNWLGDNSSPERLRALSRTVVLISSFQIPKCIGSPRLSAMVDFDSTNPVHAATRNYLKLMADRGFWIRENVTYLLAKWKISRRGAKKNLWKIRDLHLPFARVFMDEGHNVRNVDSECLTWLKYIRSPVWIVSGSSGWMPPKKWTGWVKVWEREAWATHVDMKRYTSRSFSGIVKAFEEAAKSFNPETGIPSPVCEIDSEGYNTDNQNAREKQRPLIDVFHKWSDFLQQAMIRRTHRDLIWGEPLLELPKGEIKVICVRFCDTEKKVHRNYQEAVRAAISDACRGAQGQVPSNTQTRQALMINMYRRCRIASSIPALCCIPSFKDGNWTREDVEGYGNQEGRCNSPYKAHIYDIIRLSPKLLWLRHFILEDLRLHSEASNEKLLIFSFSPTVLHCVDLV